MRPINAVLVEFPSSLTASLLLDRDADHAGEGPDTDAGTPDQQSAAIREAAREEGAREAEARCEARLDAQAADHAAAIEAARAHWAAEQGERLAEGLRHGLQAVEESLARGLAEALPAFVEGAVRVRAMAEIGGAVERLLAGEQGILVTVRGPADLLAPFRHAFEAHPAVSITDDDAAVEVSVAAGDTLIATQIDAWRAGLQAALDSVREATP